jgi:hypothetical protein
MLVTLAICAILAVIGIPFALTRGSIFGWILTVLGLGGIAVLFIQSAKSQRGSQPAYDDFLVGIFFFFVFAGIFVGLPVCMEFKSIPLGMAISIVGFLAGHMLGIAAGLELQRLGWIAGTIDMLAGLGAIILSAAIFIAIFFFALG